MSDINMVRMLEERDAEIERLQNQLMDTEGLLVTAQNLTHDIRAATIEECALKLQDWMDENTELDVRVVAEAVAAIRALKEQP